MKNILSIIVFLLIVTFNLHAQKFLASTSVIKKGGLITQTSENITILMDTVKHSIKIPKYGVLLMYDPHHLDELKGFKMYVNSDYGYMLISDDLAFARFEFFNGGSYVYEFMGIQRSTLIIKR